MHRMEGFHSYWVSAPVVVPGVGTFLSCTLADGGGRQQLVAYGSSKDGRHYNYSHVPGMDASMGPLFGTSQCAALCLPLVCSALQDTWQL